MIDECTRQAAKRAMNAVGNLRVELDREGSLICESFLCRMADYVEETYDVTVQVYPEEVLIVDNGLLDWMWQHD